MIEWVLAFVALYAAWCMAGYYLTKWAFRHYNDDDWMGFA